MKLLVIDIQKGITDSRLFNFDEFIDNTSRIIQAARDNQIEVIYFQHDDGPGTGFQSAMKNSRLQNRCIQGKVKRYLQKISIVVSEIKILQIMLKMKIH